MQSGLGRSKLLLIAVILILLVLLFGAAAVKSAFGNIFSLVALFFGIVGLMYVVHAMSLKDWLILAAIAVALTGFGLFVIWNKKKIAEKTAEHREIKKSLDLEAAFEGYQRVRNKAGPEEQRRAKKLYEENRINELRKFTRVLEGRAGARVSRLP